MARSSISTPTKRPSQRGVSSLTLDGKHFDGVTSCLIMGADDAIVASTVRAVQLLFRHMRLQRLVATDIARRPLDDLLSLAPGGLFGPDAITVIDGVQDVHAARLPDWMEILAGDGDPPLLLVSSGAKRDGKLRSTAASRQVLVLDAAAGASGAVLSLLLDAPRFSVLSKTERDVVSKIAGLVPLLDLERRLEQYVLARPADSTSDPDELRALLTEPHSASDRDLARAVLSGDTALALALFQNEIRSLSDLSGLLSRLPYVLARNQIPDRPRVLLEILSCERAVRSQNPFAFPLSERMLVRLARRIAQSK